MNPVSSKKTIPFWLLTFCAFVLGASDLAQAETPRVLSTTKKLQPQGGITVSTQPILLPVVPDGVYFGHNLIKNCQTGIPKPGKMQDLPAPFDIEITISGGKATQVTNFGKPTQILQSPGVGQLGIVFVYNGNHKFTGTYHPRAKKFEGTLQSTATLQQLGSTGVVCSGPWGADLKLARAISF